ncbi:hydroxypyruvate isomerase [Marinimicrobium koreense]|uniref:Hydroxypyruvate isomerase n=1 Tax=Marinimicrobium koreense TaxID=306545 RepID=A0A3N1NDK8_9GAMM|nr:TIM barrel protein [Marinimicrobium koreense]ROQ17994.1 hydroxypyruvate isomerase [Marinimicrobium koreense]
MTDSLNRRALLRGAVASAFGVTSLSALGPRALADHHGQSHQLKGNIRHSVARWTYDFLSVEELCQLVKRIGFSAIDLIGPKEWHILKEHGVDSSMCNGAELSLEEGFGNAEHHSALIESYRKHIDLVSDAGYTNLICFSGNARGMDPEDGLKAAVTGLKKVLAQAEKRGVVLQMELFNSKVDHPDYLCDSSAWGIELCKRLDSPNFKLLYDIYHMQIMEGDIIRTIRDSHQYFGHYHTAGVPGRHEIDDSQELYYPAIMRAIQEVDFKGYVAQEFIPARATDEEKVESLKAAIKICDV